MNDLAKAIKQIKSVIIIPHDVDLWDSDICAAYFKRSQRHFTDRIATLPNFPQAIRLPAPTGKSQPLYKAVEVIAFAEKYQEKRVA